MIYVKHPEHGNRHISDEDVAAYVADGWVVWPRSAAEKAGIAAPAPVAPEPTKRGPGRPRKVQK
jgi:hypothetical protein